VNNGCHVFVNTWITFYTYAECMLLPYAESLMMDDRCLMLEAGYRMPDL